MPKFLTPQEVQFYKDNGYIKINVLEKAEIDALSEEYDLLFRLQANEDMDSTWIGEDMEKASNNKKTSVSEDSKMLLCSVRVVPTAYS